jgi:hypothetical protein
MFAQPVLEAGARIFVVCAVAICALCAFRACVSLIPTRRQALQRLTEAAEKAKIELSALT